MLAHRRLRLLRCRRSRPPAVPLHAERSQEQAGERYRVVHAQRRLLRIRHHVAVEQALPHGDGIEHRRALHRGRLFARLPRRYAHRVPARHPSCIWPAHHSHLRHRHFHDDAQAQERHDRGHVHPLGAVRVRRTGAVCGLPRYAGHRRGVHHHAQCAAGGIHLVHHHRIYELRLARPVLLRPGRLDRVARLPRHRARDADKRAIAFHERPAHQCHHGHLRGHLHAGCARPVPQGLPDGSR